MKWRLRSLKVSAAHNKSQLSGSLEWEGFLCRSPMLCCLTASHLAALQGWNNNSEDEHQCHQQPPSKTNRKEGSAAEQPLHWESAKWTGPPDHFSLLTSFACASLIIFFVPLDPVWEAETQAGTWCWQRLTDNPRPSAVYLWTVNTVVSVVFLSFCFPSETPCLIYCRNTS